ncbi:hypothetical protein SRHO_G00049670 [Serrasalmus rhombeus]
MEHRGASPASPGPGAGTAAHWQTLIPGSRLLIRLLQNRKQVLGKQWGAADLLYGQRPPLCPVQSAFYACLRLSQASGSGQLLDEGRWVDEGAGSVCAILPPLHLLHLRADDISPLPHCCRPDSALRANVVVRAPLMNPDETEKGVKRERWPTVEDLG